MGARMSAAEAAARLGVKKETLYAYVSRGMLTSERAADRRSTTFSSEEVEAMAARARRGGRAGGLELIVASALTSLSDGSLRYRGVDVGDLVPGTSFEAVAEWLWTGESLGPVAPWARVGAEVPVAGIDGLRVAVATAGDALRYDLSPAAVAAAGRRAIAAMVESLPLRRQPTGDSIAARLSARMSPDDHGPIVDAALVLLADHELAASTLAARIAASVRADPYSVVSTGLGVIAGGLHGAASAPVVSMLQAIGSPGQEAAVVGELLRRRERIPGLGHKVYRRVDPRAEILLDLVRAEPMPAERWEVVERLLALLRARFDLVVNIDFALGAFVWSAGLDVRAAESLFAIARTAGWLAHAIEEYGEVPLRFRPRAVYTGR